jgi:cellobiose phosphorylase
LGVKVQRVFRGVTYHIAVRRGEQPGVWVDGKAIAGNIIPIPQAGKQEVNVVVVAGFPKNLS